MSIWHLFDAHDFHHSDLDVDEDELSSSDESEVALGGGGLQEEADPVFTVYDYIFDCIERGDKAQVQKILDTSLTTHLNPYNQPEEINLDHPYNFLAEAVNFQRKHIFRIFLEWGCDLNMYSEGFRSSIWKYVVEHNLVNYVPRMVALGCDINLTNKAGETPLIWACSVPFQSAADSEYRFQLVQALVEQAGANINHVTKAGASVLQVAIECHFWHAAHYLAASGAVVYNTSRKRNKDKALIQCTEGDNNVELVGFLLEDGADVHAVDEFGETALMMACYQKQFKLIQRLLEAGADPTLFSKHGTAPISFGINSYNVQLVRVLLPYVLKNTPIEQLAQESVNFEVVVLQHTSLLATVLYALVLVDDVAELRRLLALYAEHHQPQSQPNAQGESVAMPLHSDEIDGIPWLLNNCVYSSYQPLFGCSLLHYAIRRNRSEIAKLLITHGADVNSADIHGSTVLMEACDHGLKDMVLLLLEHHADVNQPRTNGDTALMLAAVQQQRSIVKILLQHGADCKATNKRGQSALELNTSSKIDEMLRKRVKQKR